MTDLEMTRLCALAMGLWFGHSKSDDSDNLYVSRTGMTGPWEVYNPLHDDAQAMWLVKRLNLSIDSGIWHPEAVWKVSYSEEDTPIDSADLNRAIVECVAKMQAARSS